MTGKIFRTLQWGVISAVISMLLAGAAFAADSPEDELVVFPDGSPCVMKRVTAGSGERYEAAGDPSTFFLSDGPVAALRIGGREYPRYVLIRNFPGEDAFTLTADGRNYAMKSVISASGAKYEAEDDPSTVLWSKGRKALLAVGGQEYSDYDIWRPNGQIWLPDQNLPTGLEWKVTDIDGQEIIPGSTVTITFHPDGKLSGKASVNNYTSLWITSGYRMIITGGVSTRMAGAQNLMDQEKRFFELLSEINRFDFRREGLVLTGKNDKEILLKR
jgi:heat shock protein HslJ